MTDIALPGDYGLPATSQTYAGGMRIEDLLAQATTSPQIAPEQRFWSSPPRDISYPYSEGIIVNLSNAKCINFLTLDLPVFPHHFYFHWWDGDSQTWKEFQGPSGGTIRIYIDGAVPGVVGTAAAYQAKQHPSHYGAGHWTHYDLDVCPVFTSKIRLSGNRNFGTRKGGPVDQFGKATPYSLGVKNFDLGWRVCKRTDVPRTLRDADVLTEAVSFTQTLDLNGCPVSLKLRENRASDLLRGCVWKSEPMPVPYAVVNFYVDARDSQCQPQIIDRFNIQPLQSGACFNLYYATEAPDSNFVASDSPIVFPLTRAAGEQEPEFQDSGICFKEVISYLDIDNAAVQWDPSRPFWIGMEFQVQWDSDDITPHIIFDAGSLQLSWNGVVFRLGYGTGALYMQPIDFTPNSRMRAFISFDGEHLSFYMPETGAVANVPITLSDLSVSTIRFGGELGDTVSPVLFSGHYRLNAMVIKQETLSFTAGPDGLIVPDPIQRFTEFAIGYLDKATYAIDEDHSTDNSILRFLPKFRSGVTVDSCNPFGFVGGPGDIYDDVVWTPVLRSYTLRAGMLQFHPVKAKFFKFEFTNLTVEPYQTYMPLTRQVRCFSQQATKQASNPQLSTQVQQSASSGGLTANIDAAVQTVRYADTPAITATSTADVLPTEALTARDAGVQAKLDSMGGLYRFDAWQPGNTIPINTETSRHVYEMVEVGCSKKCAYFVGLSLLEMYRVDYIADDDTDQYIEMFDDTSNIDPDYLTGNVVIGTTNFVPNPSFENGTTGHTLYISGTATAGAIAAIADGTAGFGSNVLKVSSTSLGATTVDRVGWQATYTTPNLAASVAYSVYVRRVTGNATVRLMVEYYNLATSFIGSETKSFTPVGVLGDPINPNPYFDIDTDGWEAAGNVTLSSSSTVFHQGLRSMKIVPGGGQATVGANTVTASKLVVDASKTYRLNGWLYSVSGYADARLAIDWFASDSDGSYITTTLGTLTTLPINTWSFRTDEVTPPAGATRAKARVRMGSTPTTADILYADEVKLQEVLTPWERVSAIFLPPLNTVSAKVFWWLEAGGGAAVEYRFDAYQIENLRLTDYYDGSMTGGAWNGTANNSTSTRTDINIRPWAWDGDKLISGSSIDSVTSQSHRFSSKRRVRGLQFASQQSASVQLIPDPDFIAPALLDNWIPQGDTLAMEHSNDVNSTLGNAVKIVRSSAINTWGSLHAGYSSWGAVENSQTGPLDPTYLTLEGDNTALGYGGIRSRNPVQVSGSGRVTAAARVYASHTLATPLQLQILSSNGDVLAIAEQNVTAGKVVEWTVGHTVTVPQANPLTWASIMQRDPLPTLPTYGDLKAGLWSDLTSISTVQSRNFTVRIVQQGSGEDTWYVDSLTLFEDPILWEFSNDNGMTWWPAIDIRNNPRGVLVFPNSTSFSATDPTGLRWRVTGFRPNLHISALDIRPWYAETTFGIPPREPGVSGGPNIQPDDHYPMIEDDPFFQQWSGLVPQDWYFTYRQLLLLDRQYVPVNPVIEPDVFANELVFLAPSIAIVSPPPFLDPYEDIYSDMYGVVNPDA